MTRVFLGKQCLLQKRHPEHKMTHVQLNDRAISPVEIFNKSYKLAVTLWKQDTGMRKSLTVPTISRYPQISTGLHRVYASIHSHFLPFLKQTIICIQKSQVDQPVGSQCQE